MGRFCGGDFETPDGMQELRVFSGAATVRVGITETIVLSFLSGCRFRLSKCGADSESGAVQRVVTMEGKPAAERMRVTGGKLGARDGADERQRAAK